MLQADGTIVRLQEEEEGIHSFTVTTYLEKDFEEYRRTRSFDLKHVRTAPGAGRHSPSRPFICLEAGLRPETIYDRIAFGTNPKRLPGDGFLSLEGFVLFPEPLRSHRVR